MAKTSAERVRAYRNRKRAEKASEIKDAPADDLTPFIACPFSEFMKDRHLDMLENLDAFGIQITGSDLETDQQTFDTQVVRDEPLTALQRAEGMIDVMIDAAKELAALVNEYKLNEIDRQMKSASPANKVRLEYLRKPLTKRTSHFFPVTTAKED